MNNLIELIMLLVILINIIVITSNSLLKVIRFVAIQGVITAILTIFKANINIETFSFSLIIILLKGIFFPWMLTKVISKVSLDIGVKKSIGNNFNVLIFTVIFIISIWIYKGIGIRVTNPWLIIGSFITIFSGFVYIVISKNIISQIVGYITMENGIYLFGLSIFVHQPLIVEAAILLDIFVAIFIMGVIVFHIGTEFKDIHSDKLSNLSDLLIDEDKK